MENDGTLDESHFTSIATDGQPWTSPSVKVRSYESSSSSEEPAYLKKARMHPPNVQFYYTCGLHYELPAGSSFRCLDIHDGYTKPCYYYYYGYYECWDG